jgi:hypothetical protein
VANLVRQQSWNYIWVMARFLMTFFMIEDKPKHLRDATWLRLYEAGKTIE